MAQLPPSRRAPAPPGATPTPCRGKENRAPPQKWVRPGRDEGVSSVAEIGTHPSSRRAPPGHSTIPSPPTARRNGYTTGKPLIYL
ncbi:hypothetical protein CF70_024505 [Cupriavidus sp. SK-3]|nr:hypothetical protein CF70_024505 [Cupriavidus sp. SK-3]